jgi:arylsulfatase
VFPPDEGVGLRAVFRAEHPELSLPVTLRRGAPLLERVRSQALIKHRNFVITVALDYRVGDRGILVAHRDQGGGYSLYIGGVDWCSRTTTSATCARLMQATFQWARRASRPT